MSKMSDFADELSGVLEEFLMMSDHQKLDGLDAFLAIEVWWAKKNDLL